MSTTHDASATSSDRQKLTQPFPGLRPFLLHEAKLFFGRAEEINRMLGCLEEHRFLAVVGGSGSGKSSLVRAGLLPVLEQGYLLGAGTDWRFVVVRPGGDPFGNLAVEFHQTISAGDDEHDASDIAFTKASLQTSPRGFLEVVDEAGMDDGLPLMLLVDQFEEIFRFRRRHGSGGTTGHVDRAIHEVRNEATAFVNLLLTTADVAAQTERPIYVVITMRSDFIGDCEVFPALPEAVSNSQFLVPRMNRRQMQEVIEKPLMLFGCGAEPGMVNRILNDAGTALDQLPLLQHALMRTWYASRERWDKESSDQQLLGIEDYQTVGRFSDALSRHLEEAWKSLADERQRRIAKQLFICLSDRTSEGSLIRRMVALAEVAAVADVEVHEVIQVVRVFQQDERNFIVATPSGELTADSVLDISHEALLRQWGRLRRWLDEEHHSVEDYLRLSDSAKRWKNGEADLAQGRELQRSLEWKDSRNPTQTWAERYGPGFTDAMHYLEESRTAEEERSRRARTTRVTVRISIGLACLALVVTAGWALFSASSARQAALLAEKAEKRANDSLREVIVARSGLEKALEKANESEGRAQDASMKASLHEKAALVKALLPREPLKALVLAIEATGTSHSELGEELPRIRSSLLSAIQASGWANHFTAHDGPVRGVAMTPDGDTIATGSVDGRVQLWDSLGNPIGRPFTAHDYGVNSVAITPDGQTIVTGSSDQSVRLWNRDGSSDHAPLTVNGSDYFLSVAVTPDGNTVVAGSDEGAVWLWEDVANNRLGKRLKPEGDEGYEQFISVAISPDGSSIFGVTSGGGAWLWKREDGSLTGQPATFSTDPGMMVAITPDGQRVAIGSDDGKVQVLDHAGIQIGEPFWNEGPVTALAITSDGHRLISGSRDGHVRQFSFDRDRGMDLRPHRRDELAAKSASSEPGSNTGKGSDSPPGPDDQNNAPEPVLPARVNPRNQNVTQKGGADSGEASGEPDSTAHETNKAQLVAVAISPDGQIVSGRSQDGIVRLWDASGKPIGEHIGRSVRVPDSDSSLVLEANGPLAVSTGGSKIVAGNFDGTLRLWNRNGERIGQPIAGHFGAIASVAISQDGTTIVSGSDDGTVRLWDSTGNPLGTALSLQKDSESLTVNCVAVSPDGQSTVVGTDTGKVALLDRSDGDVLREVFPVNLSEEIFSAVAISSDGNIIVAGSVDGTIRIWDRHANRVRKPKTVRGHKSRITSIAFSRDDNLIASGEADGTVYLWDQHGNQLGDSFKGKTDSGTQMAGNAASSLTSDGPPSSGGKTQRSGQSDRPDVTVVAFRDDSVTDNCEVHSLIAVGRNTKKVWNWHLDRPNEWIHIACEMIRNHSVLIAPEDAIAHDILQEGESGAIQTVMETCLASSGWDDAERARFLTRHGQALAASNSVEAAETMFRRAQDYDSAIDLDPRTPAIDNVPAVVAEHFAAPARARAKRDEGQQFAQQGDVRAAIAAFQEAQKLDSRINLEWTAADEVFSVEVAFEDPFGEEPGAALSVQDPEVIAIQFATRARLQNGYQHARQGRIDDAVAEFVQAKRIDPDIRLDRDFEGPNLGGMFADGSTATYESIASADLKSEVFAKRLAAASKALEGYQRAQEGDLDAAIAAYQEARNFEESVKLEPYSEIVNETPGEASTRLVARAKADEGTELARKGEIADAIAAFKTARQLNPVIRLAPYSGAALEGDVGQDPDFVAGHLAAQQKAVEAHELAATGDEYNAVEVFREAQKFDPEINLDLYSSFPDSETGIHDALVMTRRLVAEAKISEAHELAQQFEIARAVEALKKAQSLSPDIVLDPNSESGAQQRDPEAVANRLVAEARIVEGHQFVENGDIRKATTAFQEARRLRPEISLNPYLYDPDQSTGHREPEAVARRLIANIKVREGLQLAQEGYFDEAIATLQQAQTIDATVSLDPDSEHPVPAGTVQDPQTVVDRLAARSKVEEGLGLARSGYIDEAIAVLEEARKLDPLANLDPNIQVEDSDDPDSIIVQQQPAEIVVRLAAQVEAEKGRWHAVDGNTEKAIAAFLTARELSPEIDLDPETTTVESDPEEVVKRLVSREKAGVKVAEGLSLLEQEQFDRAITAFEEALKLDPDSVRIDAQSWNLLGWRGCLNGHAEDVLFACEKAVALADDNPRSLAAYRDTRGLARALTGDTNGAIEDFEAFIACEEWEEYRDKRQNWVDVLRQGGDPFTPELLESLKDE